MRASNSEAGCLCCGPNRFCPRIPLGVIRANRYGPSPNSFPALRNREERNKAANKDVPPWREWSSLLPFPFLFCQLLSHRGVIHGATVADKKMPQLPCSEKYD
ncbi:hypothetical protein ROHU_005483 [Labeo rohita]|uniref:Uncharacterized protein n=1 Tax=Labeo rohita TaxID=84645 RepID=A0A498N672_LABRO|nr:hypothetical protein ROHU_005483 [Labeo rohita]